MANEWCNEQKHFQAIAFEIGIARFYGILNKTAISRTILTFDTRLNDTQNREMKLEHISNNEKVQNIENTHHEQFNRLKIQWQNHFKVNNTPLVRVHRIHNTPVLYHSNCS